MLRSSEWYLPLWFSDQNSVSISQLSHSCSPSCITNIKGVSKSFRTGRLERELQMVQTSATRCSCIAILWINLVSFAAITLCVASQQVFIVVSGVFRYRRNPETFGYTLINLLFLMIQTNFIHRKSAETV
jgi:hypothetical protein